MFNVNTLLLEAASDIYNAFQNEVLSAIEKYGDIKKANAHIEEIFKKTALRYIKDMETKNVSIARLEKDITSLKNKKLSTADKYLAILQKTDALEKIKKEIIALSKKDVLATEIRYRTPSLKNEPATETKKYNKTELNKKMTELGVSGYKTKSRYVAGTDFEDLIINALIKKDGKNYVSHKQIENKVTFKLKVKGEKTFIDLLGKLMQKDKAGRIVNAPSADDIQSVVNNIDFSPINFGKADLNYVKKVNGKEESFNYEIKKFDLANKHALFAEVWKIADKRALARLASLFGEEGLSNRSIALFNRTMERLASNKSLRDKVKNAIYDAHRGYNIRYITLYNGKPAIFNKNSINFDIRTSQSNLANGSVMRRLARLTIYIYATGQPESYLEEEVLTRDLLAEDVLTDLIRIKNVSI